MSCIDPEILHTVCTCLCPYRAFHEWVGFYMIRQIFGLYFLGYSSLKGSHISSEKKNIVKERLGRGHVEHVQKIRVYLSITAWRFMWTFVR